eukprot:scaffold44487_cov18-Tisochrysis_lutea.AAC.2
MPQHLPVCACSSPYTASNWKVRWGHSALRKCSICGIRRWSWLTLPRCSQGGGGRAAAVAAAGHHHIAELFVVV